jgi:hypothetical protein
MKSGKLNFLEPSGPLQDCNGTALLLPLPMFDKWFLKIGTGKFGSGLAGFLGA